MMFLIFTLFTLSSAILNKKQWVFIEKCLQHPNITPVLRNEIENILFVNYLPLAYKEHSKFVNFHKYKSRIIVKDDLKHYSVIGLYHATRKYNGRSNFYKYAQTYIKGSLYKGLTKHYPISKEKEKERRVRSRTVYNGFDSIEWTTNKYLGKNNYLESVLRQDTIESQQYMWDKINNQTPFIKTIIHKKFDFDFNVIKPNIEIGNEMNYSEEWIRRNVYKTVTNLTDSIIYVARR